MRSLLAVLLVTFGLSLVSAAPACACKCVPIAESDAVAAVDVVVKAEAVKVELTGNHTRQVTLRVTEAVKGDVSGDIVFTTRDSSAACGVTAKVGANGTWYLRGNGPYTAAACDQAVYADEIAQGTLPDSVPDADTSKKPKLEDSWTSSRPGVIAAGVGLTAVGLFLVTWALTRRAKTP